MREYPSLFISRGVSSRFTRHTPMVRVLMVRHAQSEQNAHMESLMLKISAGEMSITDFNRGMREGPPGTGAGDDACLSELGLAQAVCSSARRGRPCSSRRRAPGS